MRGSPMLRFIGLIPNSKRLLVVLCIMLVGVIIMDYATWQYNQSRLEERDRLIKNVNERIKKINEQMKEKSNKSASAREI